ncbi:glycosyltransferase [Paenibacillus filicis]|uniref:Glycosyltransferase n=1 Tax=Paenibacillus gyeongsangnamensis TaxID=3388067 RepID=A0ABT4QHW3_9BACL|nr:glycosyltransferase [Paenibacillus filicis]MCZ8516473.1 glycosyltransferase [Paenibacillus filicis]
MNVLILTRYYSPIRNGLSDHTELMRSLMKQTCSSVTVLCEKTADRSLAIPPYAGEQEVYEYAGYRDFLRQLSHIHKSRKTDVILFQYVPHMWGKAGVAPFAALLPIWIRLLYRIPVISFMHELHYDWSLKPKQFLLALCHHIQLFMIGVFSRFQIVTNHRRENELKRIWSRKVVRIPAGNVSGRKDESLRKTRFPWPYITWFGTLSELQRLEQLCEAFARLADKDKELRLVLVGGFNVHTPRVEALKQFAEAQGFADRLVILGFADDDELSDILHGSLVNVFIESSGPSGRRTVIAAYLRSGRPIVAIDGLETDPDFINGENVLLVPDENEAVFAERICSVTQQEGLRRRLEKGARSLYLRNYSDEAVASHLNEILALAARTHTARNDRRVL